MSGGGESDDVFNEKEARQLVMKQNRKNKKAGGFQSMGLSHAIFKGITRKGYKLPTPIQRKTIPLLMDGKDVVGMARTGSGKTAAFLIPLFERLKKHTGKYGARSLVMSPTRELALQTLKFTKELGRFTGLKAAVILGGDKMEDQFLAIHENPDIIIATPGRFLHVVMEMDLKLNAIEYVVFDEADRLFELGFQEQLKEILTRLPESRQTLLFSATLPKLLVDFAKAGLHDPTLIRLDVDTKLSPQLQMAFLHCRADDKLSLLLFLLKNITGQKEQTVIFTATKHHVDYLNMLLAKADIKSTGIYSSLDHTARKINLAKFQHKKVMVLVVTDLAARGIDIPMLDNVINFNFPARPKLFVHRVGRVARAGRIGTAYSLMSHDELAYVIDLHLFLGRPLRLAPTRQSPELDVGPDSTDCLYGAVPQSIMDAEEDGIKAWHETSTDIESMKKVVDNAYKQYVRSRPAASSQSNKRAKEMSAIVIPVHPLFQKHVSHSETVRTNMLESMKAYKPKTTIFEINSKAKIRGSEVMKEKRDMHSKAIEASHKKVISFGSNLYADHNTDKQEDSDGNLEAAFSTIIAPKPSAIMKSQIRKKKRKKSQKDEENFLPYKSLTHHQDKAMAVTGSFEHQSKDAVLDLMGDDSNQLRNKNNQMKWDRKRKRFVKETGKDAKIKKVKTESGQWIPASYKSNVYKDWLKKNNINDQKEDNYGETEDYGNKKTVQNPNKLQVLGFKTRKEKFKDAWKEKMTKQKGGIIDKPGRGEIKRKEIIVKQRRMNAKKEAWKKHRNMKRKKQKP